MSAEPEPESASSRSRPSRRAGIVARLGLALGSVVVLLGLGEIVCRVLGYGPDVNRVQYIGHPDLIYAPAPDQTTHFGREDPESGEQRLPIHINRHGQRGPDYRRRKPAGEYRIIGVGDSLTFGPGVRDDETFLARLEQLCRDEPPGEGSVRVVNAGVNGYSTWQYARWAATQLERFDPDLLLVGCYIGNDNEIVATPKLVIPMPMENLLRKSALGYFLKTTYRDLRWDRGRAREGLADGELDPGTAAYVGLTKKDLSLEDQKLLWERSIGHLETIRAAAEARGVAVACVLIPPWWELQEGAESPETQWLRFRIGKLGMPVITLLEDLWPLGEACRLPYDKGHFSALGHEVTARVLRRELGRLGLLD